MRIITAEEISSVVAELCIRANKQLPEDIVRAMKAARAAEPWPVAGATLGVLCRNIDAAGEMDLPVCQDTGMACVFARLGQDVGQRLILDKLHSVILCLEHCRPHQRKQCHHQKLFHHFSVLKIFI